MKPDLNSPYSKLVDDIANAPKSYLPGLLVAVVQACEKEKVFRAGGLLDLVKSARSISK